MAAQPGLYILWITECWFIFIFPVFNRIAWISGHWQKDVLPARSTRLPSPAFSISALTKRYTGELYGIWRRDAKGNHRFLHKRVEDDLSQGTAAPVSFRAVSSSSAGNRQPPTTKKQSKPIRYFPGDTVCPFYMLE